MEKPSTVRVLGVDPGTRIAGYAVLDVERGRHSRLVAYGAIAMPPGPVPERLEHLYQALEHLIREHRPSALAVETVFHGKSFQSVVKVGEARGVVLLQGVLHGLEIDEFTPAGVKKAATGNGRATKRQVQQMMARVFELESLPEPVDASDAIAIAFCYGQRLWRRRRPGRASLRDLAKTSRAEQSRKWKALIAKAEERVGARARPAAAARRARPADG